MERTKDIIINLSDEMLSEIEPVVERINGLEELLMIVPESEDNLRNRIIEELVELKDRRHTLMHLVCEGSDVNDCLGQIYDFDVLEKTLTISTSA